MRTGIKTYIDKSRESVFWKNSVLNFGNDTLNVEGAGITYPDRRYAIHRGRDNKRFFNNVFVIEYVTSGEGYLESDGKRLHVCEGDLYIVHRQTVHTYYADKDKPFTKKWINISGTYINALAEVFFSDGPFTVLPLGEPAEGILDKIHALFASKPKDIASVNTEVMRLLLELCIVMDDYRRSNLISLSPFERIEQFIEQNISSELTVSYICQKFFISPTTLYRMFTANVGQSPKAYIQSKKIAAAKRMIAANDSTIHIIAHSLGFYDSHHFLRVFRSVTGMSPSEYKKQLLEIERE